MGVLSQKHRVVRLVGTSGGRLVQPLSHLEVVAQGHVQTAFEHLQGWRLHYLQATSVSSQSSLQ